MGETRRRFLSKAAAGALGAGALLGTGCSKHDVAGAPAARPRRVEPSATSRVVRVTHPSVVASGDVDASAVSDMIAQGMRALLDEDTPEAAFAALFAPQDVVAIKVNCLAGPPLSSHPEVANALADRLAGVGIPRGAIIIYDRESRELAAVGYSISRQPGDVRCLGSDEVGYDSEPTLQGSVGTCFSRILSSMATALINVPVMKDHDVAGVSGALKNHYGSIHNPNKLHMDHCSPYIADLNCADAIRSRQRLIVFDALFACYDGGPGYKPATTVGLGQLLFATDPVAIDWVCHQQIEDLRRRNGLAPLEAEERAPVYIAEAASPERGLGNADADSVEVVDVEIA